jgi:hypothetical protein
MNSTINDTSRLDTSSSGPAEHFGRVPLGASGIIQQLDIGPGRTKKRAEGQDRGTHKGGRATAAALYALRSIVSRGGNRTYLVPAHHEAALLGTTGKTIGDAHDILRRARLVAPATAKQGTKGHRSGHRPDPLTVTAATEVRGRDDVTDRRAGDLHLDVCLAAIAAAHVSDRVAVSSAIAVRTTLEALATSRRVDADGYIALGVEEIGADAGIGRQTASRTLGALAKAGAAEHNGGKARDRRWRPCRPTDDQLVAALQAIADAGGDVEAVRDAIGYLAGRGGLPDRYVAAADRLRTATGVEAPATVPRRHRRRFTEAPATVHGGTGDTRKETATKPVTDDLGVRPANADRGRSAVAASHIEGISVVDVVRDDRDANLAAPDVDQAASERVGDLGVIVDVDVLWDPGIPIDRTVDDSGAAGGGAAARLAAMPTEAVDTADDAEVTYWSGQVLAYYLAWRKEHGLGRLRNESWTGQIRRHVKELLVDGWAPKAVCDIVGRWHDSSMERVRDGGGPLPPGVIKNVAQGLADASDGAAKHGTDGHGTTRAQQRANDQFKAHLAVIQMFDEAEAAAAKEGAA